MDGKVELLAPAGSWDAFVAAVENGADGVYLGGRMLNARQHADNFDDGQLERAVDYAHVRGVNVYLTVNTLVSDREMKRAVDFALRAYEMGMDGIIVQDIGFAGLVKKAAPALPLHASTQMTIYNLEGVRVLESMGFKRVIPARELPLEEINNIVRNTSMEVEIFVHGALCVSYSGQCLMSSIIGGRSGNRGKCAQPCRLPYELVSHGPAVSRGEKTGYLLSPRDLCTVHMLDRIVGTGVRSLKIEGRMKSPEYVATVVRVYRKYLDAALQSRAERGGKNIAVDDADMRDLAQIFSRGGFTDAYLTGGKGRGMMWIERGAAPEGDKACRTSDKSLNARARESFGGIPKRKVGLRAELTVRKGMPVVLHVRDDEGNSVKAASGSSPEEAVNRPLTVERAVEQLQKTGPTPFEFSHIGIDLEENLTVPVSVINSLRRQTLGEIEKARAQNHKREITGEIIENAVSFLNPSIPAKHAKKIPGISLFFYSPGENTGYAGLGADRIYLPFGQIAMWDESKIESIFGNKSCELYVWLPGITWGNYASIMERKLPALFRKGLDGVMIGNIGSLGYMGSIPGISCTGNLSLNAYNSYSISRFYSLGLNGITLSPELNLGQIKALADTAGIQKEVVVYGRIPLMTSEYCAPGSLLGGLDKGKKCSAICEKGVFGLKDRTGAEFPVMCDRIDCRSTILNSRVLFYLDSVDKLAEAGIDMVRLDITDEEAREAAGLVSLCRDVIREGPAALGKHGPAVERIKSAGYTRGHFNRGV